jgi:two-component system sensor histidine kinase UhpB
MISVPLVAAGAALAAAGIVVAVRALVHRLRATPTAYFERLFETAPDAIAIGDLTGRILRINGEFTRLFGFTPQEAVGRCVDDLIVPADKMEEARQGTQSAGGGTRAALETVRQRKDGSLVAVALMYTPIPLGAGTQAVYSIYRDISERKRAEAELRQSEAKFWTAFRASPESMAISSLEEGRYLDVNDQFTALTGWTRDEALGRSTHELGLWVFPEQRAGLIEQLTRDGRVRDFEFPIRRRDGAVRYISLSGDIVEVNGVRCVLTAGRDVTERKEAEEHLRRSRHQLRRLAARLEAVREEERTAIAREIHDELSQALTGFRLDLSWMRQALPRAPKALALRLDAMVAQVDGTIDAVRRILNELRPAVLDELGLVAAVEWQTAAFEQRTGIRCHLTVRAERNVDRARSTAVFRILQEALTNVARHAQANRVDVELTITRTAVQLEVRDDGRGLPRRLPPGDRGGQRGGGLGLVGMRERALSWEGELEVTGGGRRGQGGGATVRLRLPLRRSQEPAPVA